MLKNQLEELLKQWVDPYTGQHLSISGSLKRLDVLADKVQVEIQVGYPLGDAVDRIRDELIKSMQPLTPLPIELNIVVKIVTHVNSAHVPALKNVKNIIAVGSGKGGVGKSTIAFHLAQAIAKLGARVGVLDADIYGPSQPSMFGLQGEKPQVQDGKLLPLVRNGIQTMSMGYLIDEAVPMIWRGPMLGKAFQQIMMDTAWDNVDYLVVDLPPGTGDVQLTLCQKLPVTGGLLVTTPQELALLDVRRAAEMLRKLNVPIFGFVENMSGHTCSACGHKEAIFGNGGGDKMASLFNEALLAKVPLDYHIRESTDQGHYCLQQTAFHHQDIFIELALKVTAKIACMPKDYSAKFPTIKIEG